MRFLRSSTTALAVLGLAASFAVLGPAGSAGAASCHGSSCTGLDPQATGCSADGVTTQTLEPTNDPNVIAYLRYSAACGASWVKVYSSSAVAIQGTVYGNVWNNNTRSWWASCIQSTTRNAYGTTWSKMCGGYPNYDLGAQAS
ncbi:DUF2690 domain-containing protein [Actinacidiphila acidipaludis]|uniref:YjfA family protein n=1 Tax=Actinacidiphila acidipaludis TaxID=2873382 RepID=A0ABS7QAY9_9ACTN|nr:DUF2690 domain-containing protein [Streptomyces acidipaludis]MBY8880303.1 YjfA family protein [Streptomyces acidipaludis]